MTRGAGDLPAVLLRVCDWLEARGIRYQIGGSLASSIHGVPRQTRDVDLVVDLPAQEVPALVDAFAGEFYLDADQAARAVRDRRSFNLVHLASGVKVDIFVAGDGAYDRRELDRSVRVVLDGASGRELPVKSAEDTILRKLIWYRDGGGVSESQWRDVLGVLKLRWADLDRPYLDRWAAKLRLDRLLERAVAEAVDAEG